MMFFHRLRMLFYLLFLLNMTSAAYSYDQPLLPEEESPATFVEVSKDSEDVQLFLTGSWKINMSASTGFGISSAGGFDSSLSYSGISQGFSFSQSPDLTTSLLILERYLFEAAFTDDFDDSTFRLGYIGQPGEFVQSISVGNMGINLTDSISMSDYFYIPGGGPSSFGLHTSLEGPFSEHQLLFRFDPGSELNKVYIGSDLVTEIELETTDYIRGRYFYISDITDDSSFYVETSSNESTAEIFSGRNFRPLAAEEFSYSSSSGLLILEEKPSGALYVKTGDATWSLIYEPGIESEYEAHSAWYLNTTLPSDSWKTRVYLGNIELSVNIDDENGIVIVSPYSGGTLKNPLAGITVDSSDGGSYSGEKLIFQIRESSTSYSVDDPVDGTVRVFINEIENFNWDESGGVITFNTPPGSEDRIEISWRKASGGDTSGDILIASANNFNITDSLTANLHAGLRLNPNGDYSLPGEETSAYGSAAAGISFESPDSIIKAELTGGVKFLTENSTGRLLLKNMSESGYEISFNRNTVFPASLSSLLANDKGLTIDGRGELLYKDYRLPAGFSSYYLQDYSIDDLSEDMIFLPSESTSSDTFKAGPYTTSAQTSDSRTGEILALDYILPGSSSWCGVQLPISNGNANIDLSDSLAFSFDCKSEADLSDIELYIEIGSISEDLDGDGILDAETSQYSTGFTFNDPNTPSASGTLIGGDNLTGSNNITDTEDFNSTGFLDAEQSDAIAVFSTDSAHPDSFYDGFSKPSSDWKRVRLFFTDNADDTAAISSDLTAQERLRDAEFIRITAINTSSTETSGRILFDDFRFEGVSMNAIENTDFSQPDFSEISDIYIPSSETPDVELSTPTLTAGESNNLMRIEWGVNSSDDWKLYSYINAIPPDEYNTIVFYILNPSITPAGASQPMLNFNLLDSAGIGITASIPLTASLSWRKIEIHTGASDGTAPAVYVDNSILSGAAIGVDAAAGDLVRMEISSSDTAAGVLYIDEIYLEDPMLHVVSGLNGSIEIDTGAPVLSAGGVDIIGAVRFRQDAGATVSSDTSALTEDFSSAVLENSSFDFYSSLNTSILSAPVSAQMSWNDAGGENLISAGHSVKIPIPGNWFTLTDSFTTDSVLNAASEGNFTKINSIALKLPFLSGNLAGFSASLNSGLLTKSWESSLQTDFDIFNLGISADLLLSDTGEVFNWNNYFSGWYDGTILAGDFSVDSSAGAVLKQRRTTLSASPSLSSQPLGINGEISLEADTDNSGITVNTSTISLNLPLSIKLLFDNITSGLSLSRSGEFSFDTASVDFISDIELMFNNFGSRSYLYSSIPVYELFDSNLPDLFYSDCSDAEIDQANLSSSARINLSRNYTSRLIDLFIPYSVDFGFERNIEKDYSQLEDSLLFDLIWRSAALNLFGAAGVYSIFDFYFSDEFNWSVEAEIDSPFSPNSGQEYIFTSGCSFFGHEDQIFSLDGTFYLPSGVEDKTAYLKTGIMYVWSQFPDNALDIPLFTTEEESFQVFTHEEKLSLNFDDSFSTEFRHTTSLIIPQRFTLSVFALAGMEVETLEDNSTALFGFSFGVSGSLIY